MQLPSCRNAAGTELDFLRLQDLTAALCHISVTSWCALPPPFPLKHTQTHVHRSRTLLHALLNVITTAHAHWHCCWMSNYITSFKSCSPCCSDVVDDMAWRRGDRIEVNGLAAYDVNRESNVCAQHATHLFTCARACLLSLPCGPFAQFKLLFKANMSTEPCTMQVVRNSWVIAGSTMR